MVTVKTSEKQLGVVKTELGCCSSSNSFFFFFFQIYINLIIKEELSQFPQSVQSWENGIFLLCPLNLELIAAEF